MPPGLMLLRRSATLLLALFLHALPAVADMELPASKAAPTAVIWAFAADSVSDQLPHPLPCGEYDPCFAESAVLAHHYPHVQHLSAADVRRYPPERAFEIHIPPERPAQLS